MPVIQVCGRSSRIFWALNRRLWASALLPLAGPVQRKRAPSRVDLVRKHDSRVHWEFTLFDQHEDSDRGEPVPKLQFHDPVAWVQENPDSSTFRDNLWRLSHDSIQASNVHVDQPAPGLPLRRPPGAARKCGALADGPQLGVCTTTPTSRVVSLSRQRLQSSPGYRL
jgi:hypothetical protein